MRVWGRGRGKEGEMKEEVGVEEGGGKEVGGGGGMREGKGGGKEGGREGLFHVRFSDELLRIL